MSDNLVACAICNRTMASINNKHLMSHGITANEYKLKYPDSPMRSEAVIAKKKIAASKANEHRIGVKRTEEELLAIRNGIAAKGSRKGIPTGPKSEQGKANIREGAKKRSDRMKLNGGSPLKGTSKSQEVKNKISETLKGRPLSPEARINWENAMIGAREKRKINTELKWLKQWSDWDFDVIIEDDKYKLTCRKCSTSTIYSKRSHSSFSSEICKVCNPIQLNSKAELEIYEYVNNLLKDEVVISGDRTILNPFELDIFIPSRNIAIEYCGLYYHSEKAGKSRYYHYKKLDECRKRGIRLIQIFEDEYLYKKDIVLNKLHNLLVYTKPIYARKCHVDLIDGSIAKQFLEQYHIQGPQIGSKLYGLFYDNNLVMVATFGSPNITRGGKAEWELLRMASSMNVVGGASKLFNKFIIDNNPSSIISYSDLRWSIGTVYEKLGFKFIGETVPGYWYVKGSSRTHRWKLRKTSSDPVDKTEWEIRQEEGWYRIWDCGHQKWLWTKEGN